MASGIILAVLIFIWLGMSRYFEKGQYYAIYFNESVQGLDVDSPLKYRGVMIGRVTRNAVALRKKDYIESLTAFGKEAQAEPVLFVTL